MKDNKEEVGTITIEGPWGTSKIEPGVSGQIIEMGLKQLKHIQKTNDNDYLRKDIEGYEEILNSSFVDDNAAAFIANKHKRIEEGNRFYNNMEVVNYLKENNLWKN